MKAIDARLAVREARPGTGLGLFAASEIAQGRYITDYTGTKIPSSIADTLRSKYLFELDESWTIDGSSEENTARYINHSCDPNTEAEIIDGRIVITAKRRIGAGEELTLDYGQEYFDDFIRPNGCKCGSLRHR